MIVNMQKVTLLSAATDRESTLEVLRNLGVMHIEHINRPEGDDLEKARAHLLHLKRALEILPQKSDETPTARDASDVVEEVWSLIQQKKDLQEKQEILQHERQRIVPFGSFDPALIRQLKEKGIHVRLYQAGIKQALQAPDGASLTVLSQDKTNIYFAVIGRDEFTMPAQEILLPELSLEGLNKRLSEAARQTAEVDAKMTALAAEYGKVKALVRQAEERVKYLEVRNGMGALKPIVYLQGYCPESSVGWVRQSASQHGWGLIIEEPGPDDAVPTLLENPAWVKPIKAVFDFIGVVPGYREVDISTVFLIFFSLFFAMLVGDAGYGVIFLGLTVWARKKNPQAPGYIFALLTITAVATIVWGVMTGTYFGIDRLPAPLQNLKVNWLSEQNNLMGLCFLIGAIQLSIAHLWNAWNNRRSLLALAQLGWLCTTWTMFFAAGSMVLGRPFPSFMLGVLVVGVVLIVFFMTPIKSLKKEWFNHVMLPLNLISNFVDVVSYIRLFAVGTATLAVAQAFNSMAVGDGNLSWIRMLFAAVILLLGHTLNIVLAAMGVIVHGVRLNTLEFSGHLGMQWTGILYQPFARHRDDVR